MGAALPGLHAPADDLAAPDVEDEVQVPEVDADRGLEVHDVPALDPSVDTSNPATDRHFKTGHHDGGLRLVIGSA
jgi:hypothetical protein